MVLMDDVTAARIWDCIASLSTFEGWLCVISRSEFGGWSLASLRICLGAALFRSWERWRGIRLRRRRLLTRQQDTSDLKKDSNCHLMSDLVGVQQKINPHKVNVSFFFLQFLVLSDSSSLAWIYLLYLSNRAAQKVTFLRFLSYGAYVDGDDISKWESCVTSFHPLNDSTFTYDNGNDDVAWIERRGKKFESVKWNLPPSRREK